MLIKDHQLLAYFGLAYVISWAIWSPLVLAEQGLVDVRPSPALHFAGSYGPLLSAFLVSGFCDGYPGIRELVGRLLHWRVGFGWYLVVFSPVVLFLLGVLVARLLSGAWPSLNQFGSTDEFPRIGWLAGWVLWLATFGLGEETGWRGFALPRLQKGRSALAATRWLALGWALWHVPAFFYNESFIEMGILGTFGWAAGLFLGAVVLTWIFNGTRGSVLAVAVFHGTFNAAVASTQDEIALTVNMVVMAAAVALMIAGPRTLLSKVGK